MTGVGDKVKHLRERYLVMTQGELAEALGVARVSVNGWETGRNEPHPKQLRAMAELADLPASWFFEEAA